MSTTKTTAPTVTLKHLAAEIAKKHDLVKKQTEALLQDMIDSITGHLKKDDRIRISGFGILHVRNRAERMGRNPATGEPINIKASKKVALILIGSPVNIKASKKVAFRAAKELKENIN